MTGSTFWKIPSSPPHMTASWPFWAPACPPETGASMNPTPRSSAAVRMSRATAAEAVVWSTSVAPAAIPARAPSSPNTTDRRSSSLPTHTMTRSTPAAASRGVAAEDPPCSATQASARALVRLYTVVGCPAAWRWPAMG